jgi:hypothetical protein
MRLHVDAERVESLKSMTPVGVMEDSTSSIDDWKEPEWYLVVRRAVALTKDFILKVSRLGACAIRMATSN